MVCLQARNNPPPEGGQGRHTRQCCCTQLLIPLSHALTVGAVDPGQQCLQPDTLRGNKAPGLGWVQLADCEIFLQPLQKGLLLAVVHFVDQAEDGVCPHTGRYVSKTGPLALLPPTADAAVCGFGPCIIDLAALVSDNFTGQLAGHGPASCMRLHRCT